MLGAKRNKNHRELYGENYGEIVNALGENSGETADVLGEKKCQQ